MGLSDQILMEDCQVNGELVLSNLFPGKLPRNLSEVKYLLAPCQTFSNANTEVTTFSGSRIIAK